MDDYWVSKHCIKSHMLHGISVNQRFQLSVLHASGESVLHDKLEKMPGQTPGYQGVRIVGEHHITESLN